MRRVWTPLAATLALCLCPLGLSADIITTVVADADAYVEAEYYSGDHQNNNYGSDSLLRQGVMSWNRHSYMHFDLSALDGNLEVLEARLKVEWASNPFGDGATKIFAIMDETKDWDLAALPETGAGSITWATAPQNGAYGEKFFLEEAQGADAITRLIGTNPTVLNTPTPIDLDVVELVKWLLGQDNAYSSFADTDDQLTICFRENTDWMFADYYSREYTPGDDGDAPRLEITQVPEPTSLVLLALGAVAAARRRRR